MKPGLFTIAFLLVCSVSRVKSGRFEMVCGSPPDNPATIYYYGDVAAVFAHKNDLNENCIFQSVSHGVFSREIPYNLTNACGFMKNCNIRDVYTIHVETRSLDALIESVNDVELTVVCNFMAYSDAQVVIQFD